MGNGTSQNFPVSPSPSTRSKFYVSPTAVTDAESGSGSRADAGNGCHSYQQLLNSLQDQWTVRVLPAPSYALWSAVVQNSLTIEQLRRKVRKLEEFSDSLPSYERVLLARLWNLQVQREHKGNDLGVIVIQPVHSSLLASHFLNCNTKLSNSDIPATTNGSISRNVALSSFCFMIRFPSSEPTSTEYADHSRLPQFYFTTSLKNRNLWIIILRRFLQSDANLNEPSRSLNALQITIQELKNVPSNKRYFCEVYLDQVLTVRTSTKTMTSILLWAEKFHLEDLPEVKLVRIDVYKLQPHKRQRHESKMEKRVLLGSVHLVPSQLLRCTPDQWYPVNMSTSTSNNNTTFFHRQNNNDEDRSFSHSSSSHSSSVPRSPVITSQPTSTSIMLRLNTRWTRVQVLPRSYYEPLRRFLCTHAVAMVKALEQGDLLLRSTKVQSELASHLVRLLHCEHVAVEFVTNLILWELHKLKEPNLALRSNSIATKSVESFMALLCDKYLMDTLGEFVRKVMFSEEDCEVDPSKLSTSSSASNLRDSCNQPKSYNSCSEGESTSKRMESESPNWNTLRRRYRAVMSSNKVAVDGSCEADVLLAHQESLLVFVQFVWTKIRASQYVMPRDLRRLFCTLRVSLEAHPPHLYFNNNNGPTSEPPCPEDTTLRVISACFFLRLLCPAILSPSLFGLWPHYPEHGRVNRTFTLVAKVIQSLANGALFGTKEDYMTFLNDFLTKNLVHMETFLKSVCRSDIPQTQQTQPQQEIPSYATLDSSYELAVLHHQLSDLLKGQPPQSLEPLLAKLQHMLEELETLSATAMNGEKRDVIGTSQNVVVSDHGLSVHCPEPFFSMELCESEYGEPLLKAPLATPDIVNLSEHEGF